MYILWTEHVLKQDNEQDWDLYPPRTSEVKSLHEGTCLISIAKSDEFSVFIARSMFKNRDEAIAEQKRLASMPWQEWLEHWRQNLKGNVHHLLSED